MNLIIDMKEVWDIKKLGEVCEFINRGISPKYLEVAPKSGTHSCTT